MTAINHNKQKVQRRSNMTTPEKIKEEAVDLALETKVSKEVKDELIKLAESKDRNIIKYLTDQYYQSQAFRITAENQVRSLFQQADKAADKNHPVFIQTQLKNAAYQEALNKKYIDIVTDHIPICVWMKQIKGIGPMMSAYLYSRFEVTGNRYGSDFISYGGLNDNNIPWLGSAKAKEKMNACMTRYKDILDTIHGILANIVGEEHIDAIEKKIAREAKRTESNDLSLDEVEDIINVEMEKKYRTWYPVFLSEHDDDGYLSSYIDSYTQYLVHDDYATNLIYSLASSEVGRKYELVKRGTINSYSKKKKKKKYVSIDDITSFLAKPPYNLELKTKLWLISDIFVKNKNRGSMYGKLYDMRLAYETERNEKLMYKDQAEKILQEKKITDKKTKECLQSGKLTHSHLVARAKRFAVKLFVSHLYEAMYYEKYHEEAPKTYIIAIKGHHDYIAPEVDYHKYL